jgi:hypothetical protein
LNQRAVSYANKTLTVRNPLNSFFLSLFFYTNNQKMASNILRRSFASSAASTVKIGLIPADGIGREGKKKSLFEIESQETKLTSLSL